MGNRVDELRRMLYWRGYFLELKNEREDGEVSFIELCYMYNKVYTLSYKMHFEITKLFLHFIRKNI